METKDLKKYYKYKSKWSGNWLPLFFSDSISELKRFKYLIIEINEKEWKKIKESLKYELDYK